MKISPEVHCLVIIRAMTANVHITRGQGQVLQDLSIVDSKETSHSREELSGLNQDG